MTEYMTKEYIIKVINEELQRPSIRPGWKDSNGIPQIWPTQFVLNVLQKTNCIIPSTLKDGRIEFTDGKYFVGMLEKNVGVLQSIPIALEKLKKGGMIVVHQSIPTRRPNVAILHPSSTEDNLMVALSNNNNGIFKINDPSTEFSQFDYPVKYTMMGIASYFSSDSQSKADEKKSY